MPLNFFRDTIVVKRAPLITKNGMELRDWTNATEHTVSKVQVVPQSTSREFGGRTEQGTERFTLRASYSADIMAGDRIEWREETFEIDGEVFKTASPTGRVSSTRCSLVRWRG